MVMEFLDGSDLGGVLEKQENGVSPQDAVDWVIQACDAIAEAHAHGIVHRDLKPQNLFLANRPGQPPIVKVLDFGVSKMSGGAGQNQALTATGTFLGSPHYMPPEQLKSARDVDGRADLYSLGVILYELLTAHPPFDGRAFGEIFIKVLAGEYKPVRARRPDVPEGLEAVIARCLKKSRDDRFASAIELANALAPFASPLGAGIAAQVGQPKAPPPPPAPEPAPEPAPVDPRRDARRMLASTALMQPPPAEHASQRMLPAARESTPHMPPVMPVHQQHVGVQPAPQWNPAMRQTPMQRPSTYGQMPGGHYPSMTGPMPAAQQALPQPVAPPKSKSLLIAVIIGAVVFAIVGGVLIMLAVRARGHAPAPEKPATSVTHERK
jgi:serine/threonine-protein kinase